jgi:hypothetical protein
MDDAYELLKRQAEWQKSLRHLPWAEKIRLLARIRHQVIELQRQSSGKKPNTGSGRR